MKIVGTPEVCPFIAHLHQLDRPVDNSVGRQEVLGDSLFSHPEARRPIAPGRLVWQGGSCRRSVRGGLVLFCYGAEFDECRGKRVALHHIGGLRNRQRACRRSGATPSSVRTIRNSTRSSPMAPPKLHHPHPTVKPLHGNVETRLARLGEGRVDLFIAAVSGLGRIGNRSCRREPRSGRQAGSRSRLRPAVPAAHRRVRYRASGTNRSRCEQVWQRYASTGK
ncbi:hypothetical protein AB0L57_29370 [Nocardia sp. NPDC052254]|uniref:hypothetical protein n=1 Tax=Nocardia sp. NPDC052254 TaxID=3155681 RepID=UPI00341841B9